MTGFPQSVFLVAAEASGDQLGAGLIRELRDNSPDLIIKGIGGAKMAEAGVSSDFDIAPLAIMGFTEALKAYPVVRQKIRQAVTMIMAVNPRAVVLIDSWGFMIRLSEALRRAKFSGKIIKYVAPQVWAMREGRAKVLASAVDHLLTIHSFDAPYFERHGLPVTFVGNPMFDDKFMVDRDDAVFRTKHKVNNDEHVAVVLFGSRPAEIDRLFDPFAQSVANISKQRPTWKFFSPLSESVADLVRVRTANDKRLSNLTLLDESDKYDLFSAADLALACSGTVTTQLAITGVPSVVAYKLSPVTFTIARRLFKPNFISLINISAGEALFPEFIQKDVTPDNLTEALSKYIDSPDIRAETSQALKRQAGIMKGKGGSASNRAALAIIDILGA